MNFQRRGHMMDIAQSAAVVRSGTVRFYVMEIPRFPTPATLVIVC